MSDRRNGFFTSIARERRTARAGADLRVPRFPAGAALVPLLLACVLLTAGLLTASAAPPQNARAGGAVPQAPALQLEVNYAHDWVLGHTAPDTTVELTLRDGDGEIKDQALTAVDSDGWFNTHGGNWSSGSAPDIVPGDSVQALNTDTLATAQVEPMGEIRVSTLDDRTDLVEATLHAEAFTEPLWVTCELWLESGTPPDPIGGFIDPAGGSIVCDWSTVGWDLQRGQMVALRYAEPDGDSVINVPRWPWVRVNVGENWVGADMAAGTVATIEVRDASDMLKATATRESVLGEGWGEAGFQTVWEDWEPTAPDIVPGDSVIFTMGTYSTTLTAGAISGAVDVATDSVSGTVTAPDIVPSPGSTVPVECHPWGAWDAGLPDVPVKESSAVPDGSPSYTCSWDPDTEWDVQPGQRIAVMYIEPDGDRVMDVFWEAAAHIWLHVDSQSVPAPGGNVRMYVEVNNHGDADAEDVTLTAVQDPASGLAYAWDTSGLPATSGPGTVSWSLGTLAAGSSVIFDVYFEVSGRPGAVLESALTVVTTSYTSGDPAERTFTQMWTVAENDTQLSIGKWALFGRPAAGYEFEYGVSVCNNGTTSSGAIVVTDEPGPGQSLTSWWGDQPGWEEIALEPARLSLSYPVVDPGACVTVRPAVGVDADLPVLFWLTNSATLTAASDLSPDDNEAWWEGPVSLPWVNLQVRKSLTGGVLAPGGELRYEISVRNDGNVASGPVTITELLPAGTTFAESWEIAFWGPIPLLPVNETATEVVWEIPALAPTQEFGFGVRLEVSDAVAPGTVLVNRVQAGSSVTETRYDDNETEWAEEIQEPGPNLRVTKAAYWQDQEHIRYDLLVSNVGTETVPDVVVSDLLAAGTRCTDDLGTSVDEYRIVSIECIPGPAQDTVRLALDRLDAGEHHWMGYTVSVDDPAAALEYTNQAQITIPAGDPTPEDNVAQVVSVPQGPLQWVETWVNDRGPSSITGGAEPGTEVTITAPSGTYVAVADPACGGCWAVDDLGALAPGDQITLEAGAFSVELLVPDPFTALADSAADTVEGRAGGLDYRLVEVRGDWGDNGMAWTAADGSYLANLDDIPPGGGGSVRVEEGEPGVWVSWSRPLSTLDLILEVNYGHDWVQAAYDLGHTATFVVTESDGATVKATATDLPSQTVPEWGGWTGFTTILGEPWVPSQPDIEAGDWVFAVAENGRTAQVELGEIVGMLDLNGDTVSGTISLPGAWATKGWCAVWVDGGPEIHFPVATGGGDYLCDLGAAGWDLRAGQDVAVGYFDAAGHRVMNVFREEGYSVYLPLVTR